MTLILKKLLFLTLISSTFLFAACDKEDDDIQEEGPHTVKYNISSPSTMNVSYTDYDGTLKSVSNVTSSWTYKFNTPGNGRIFKLIIHSTNVRPVSGSIYVDGQEATQDNSTTGSVILTTQIP